MLLLLAAAPAGVQGVGRGWGHLRGKAHTHTYKSRCCLFICKLFGLLRHLALKKRSKATDEISHLSVNNVDRGVCLCAESYRGRSRHVAKQIKVVDVLGSRTEAWEGEGWGEKGEKVQ